MLKLFDKFREILDDIMLQAMHKRVVLYGYGYTGRFLRWYADYYHSIKVDYVVSMDMARGQAYDLEIFRKSLFDFHYKDVKDAIIWLAEPVDEETSTIMKNKGYIRNKTYFDFYDAIYGNDLYWQEQDVSIDIRKKGKSGKRDIQFLEWLEWKYGCNFLTAIEGDDLAVAGKHGTVYRVTTQKEIFPILDRCHCIPDTNDAIFDYGCGKGGAMLSFWDYGFQKVGGVEYQDDLYEIMLQNFKKLNLNSEVKSRQIECIHGDAAKLGKELDEYNWFYYFDPFEGKLFWETVERISESLERNPRKVHIIDINPSCHKAIENTGKFHLTNQFTILTRQRVVNIYVTKKQFETK